jgi:hypothetical protein
MEPLSNYRLVAMWNTLIGDPRSIHLVPLADILKERGLLKTHRTRKAITRKFVPDEVLAAKQREARRRKPAPSTPKPVVDVPCRTVVQPNFEGKPVRVFVHNGHRVANDPGVLKPTGTAKPFPMKPVQPVAVTPAIDTDRVIRCGRLLKRVFINAQWGPDNVDPLIVKRTPGLKQILRMGFVGSEDKRKRDMQKRLATYQSFFVKHAWKWFHVRVHNMQTGATFKALVQTANTLVELRAGLKRGEMFVSATPVKWSDLT